MIDLPRPRDRRQMIHDARYYTLRNRMVDFLIDHAAAGTRRDPTASADVPNAPVVVAALSGDG